MLLIILLILLDQVSKYFFTKTINYGAAFNILTGYTTFLIIFSLITLGFVIYYYTKNKDNRIKLSLSFLIAGIIGNLIDRITLGYVRDFIDLPYWPVFNFADMFNVVGVIFLLYIVYKKK